MKIQYQTLFMKSKHPKTPWLHNLSMEKTGISLQLSLCFIHSGLSLPSNWSPTWVIPVWYGERKGNIIHVPSLKLHILLHIYFPKILITQLE